MAGQAGARYAGQPATTFAPQPPPCWPLQDDMYSFVTLADDLDTKKGVIKVEDA
jgi:hypothetical protein